LVLIPGIEVALQHLAIDMGLSITFLLEQSQDSLGVANAIARPSQHCRRQFAGMA